MKPYLLIFVLFFCFNTLFAQRKVVLFINPKNECLACNIGIHKLLSDLHSSKINTEIYFKGISKFQLDKFIKEVDYEIHKFQIINSKVEYEKSIYNYTALHSNDSYFIVLEKDKVVYKSNLIKLVESDYEIN